MVTNVYPKEEELMKKPEEQPPINQGDRALEPIKEEKTYQTIGQRRMIGATEGLTRALLLGVLGGEVK